MSNFWGSFFHFFNKHYSLRTEKLHNIHLFYIYKKELKFLFDPQKMKKGLTIWV